MEEYLREIKVVVDSLAAIDFLVSELELITPLLTLTILMMLVTAVQYYGGSSSFDDLRTKLIMFEHWVKLHNKRVTVAANHQAFATNTNDSRATGAAAGVG